MHGLALYDKVRLTEQCPKIGDMQKLQRIVNQAIRMALNIKLKDRVPIKDLLQKINISSVNQLAAEEKLKIIWQAMWIEDHPIKTLLFPRINNSNRESRRDDQLFLEENKGGRVIQECSKLWNQLPEEIRFETSYKSAKEKLTKFIWDNIPV